MVVSPGNPTGAAAGKALSPFLQGLNEESRSLEKKEEDKRSYVAPWMGVWRVALYLLGYSVCYKIWSSLAYLSI